MHLCTNIIQRNLQVSIFIQVSNDVSSYLMFFFSEMGELKLPKEMVKKGGSLREKIFERRLSLSVLRGLPVIWAEVVVPKITLPVVIISPFPLSLDFGGLLGLCRGFFFTLFS
jgi:hypothetical protein